MSRGLSRQGVLLIALIAVPVITAAVWCLEAMYQSIEAERNTQSACVVMEALKRYVEMHRKRPDNEDQLANDIAFTGGFFDWPDDRRVVMARLTIHYDVGVKAMCEGQIGERGISVRLPMFRRVVDEKRRQLSEFVYRSAACRDSQDAHAGHAVE